MKIAVTVTLDIDPTAWELDYGVSGQAAIRADVKHHAALTLLDLYTNLGMLKET